MPSCRAGDVAIAIGAMVDAAVVMIENAHKHLEAWRHDHPDREPEPDEHWRVMVSQRSRSGRLFSLLIITLSFIPVFTQVLYRDGYCFAPLAFTKTYASHGGSRWLGSDADSGS